jgi:hypothetical protein
LTRRDDAALERRESTTFRAPHGNDKVMNGRDISSQHVYEVRPRKGSSRRRSDFRCAAFRSAVAGEPNAPSNAIGYANHCSRSQDAVIRVYDEAGNVIETHEHKGDFKD